MEGVRVAGDELQLWQVNVANTDRVHLQWIKRSLIVSIIFD